MNTRLSVALSSIGLGAALLLAGCSASGEESSKAEFTNSPYANVDLANTRHARSSIHAATVSALEPAWTLPLAAKGGKFGAYVSTPVVRSGVAYSEDQASNVQAIDLSSGDVLWEKAYESTANGPNGVVVGDGLVFGATTTAAFALNAKTGAEVWSTPLARNASEQIAMAPGYRHGLVYLSTSPAAYKGGEVGVLWALDAKTGKKVWHFDTVPRGLWGHPDVNFGGGLSFAPAFDGHGAMYVGTGNAGPIPGTKRYPWGSSRPGPNLYTDSVVKLDARTGKMRWHYQLTPHSLCNWDLGAPILMRAGGRDLVVTGGLSGIVVALDRDTGKLVWKRSVGRHNGHDADGLAAMKGDTSNLHTPMTVYPGKFGGVFGQMSASGGTVFVPVVDFATIIPSQVTAAQIAPSTGELVALDAATGAPRWKHSFSSPPYGGTTATNDLVFASDFAGTAYAFAADSGRELWKESLPGGINGGLAISGGTLLAPAGYAGTGQKAVLSAFRLPG